MRNAIVFAMLLATMICPRLALSASPDSALTVYRLTGPQAQSLDLHDSQLSPFWLEAWGGRDSAEMSWPNSAVVRIDTSRVDSTRVVVRAGCLDSGVCFSVIMRYDQAVCPSDTDQSLARYDRLVLMLDTLAPAMLRDTSRHTKWYGIWALTRSSLVLSAGVNPSCILDTLAVVNNFANWVFISSSPIVTTTTYGRTPSVLGGLSIDRISIDDRTKALEVFVPWGLMGRCTVYGTGGLTGTLLPGRVLSFACEFADADSTAFPNQATMAWQCASPFSTASQGEIAAPQVTAWGSLIISDTVNIVSTTHPMAALPSHHTAGRARQQAAAFYDLRGRRLTREYRTSAPPLVAGVVVCAGALRGAIVIEAK